MQQYAWDNSGYTKNSTPSPLLLAAGTYTLHTPRSEQLLQGKLYLHSTQSKKARNVMTPWDLMTNWWIVAIII